LAWFDAGQAKKILLHGNANARGFHVQRRSRICDLAVILL